MSEMLDSILKDIPKEGKEWHNIMDEHHKYRLGMVELNMHITKAMVEYLKCIGETDDFTLRFEDYGSIDLHCNGDLFDLEQIGDFCDVFNLKLLINNRTVVENHMEDRTDVRTRYLFSTGKFQDGNEGD